MDYAEKILENFPSNYELKAKVYNSKAGIYREKKEIQVCIKYLKKTLKLRKKYLSQNDILIATSCNNLATLYRDSGESIKAEELFYEAMTILESLPDPNHPYLGTVYYNYALLFITKNMWNYKKAKKYLLKAYDIRTLSLGLNHPHTQLVINKLDELNNMRKD